MDVVHKENPVSELAYQVVVVGSTLASGFCYSAFQTFEHAQLVTFRLELADEPCPGVGKTFVIKIDRVLRNQYATEPESPCLLEQGQQRPF